MGLLLSLLGLVTFGTIDTIKTKQNAKEAAREIAEKLPDYSNPRVDPQLQKQYYITYLSKNYRFVKEGDYYWLKKFIYVKKDADGNYMRDENGRLVLYTKAERLAMAKADYAERGYVWDERVIYKALRDAYGP